MEDADRRLEISKEVAQTFVKAEPDQVSQKNWELLDRQALGVVQLTLTKNVAYNKVKETTTYSLIKALSNMYESHLLQTRYS